jgi:hypothetical protein
MMRAGQRAARQIEATLATSEHPLAQRLIRPLGIRGTGPEGRWTRRDHRRAVVAGWAILLIGWTLAFTAFGVGDQRPLGTTWNNAFSLLGLVLGFGAAYGWWRGVKHTRRAFAREAAPE